eukprot:TRINITY_DN5185_c0_g1_i1.p1 TRINITY_DN5185_c0_g1~~TRINITY_DN5185_c0_g1_i1.p1  ORF type:complete len:969 (+),score=147.75 TRINITY_DN5185_c0_g1_i1:54-2909(+)
MVLPLRESLRLPPSLPPPCYVRSPRGAGGGGFPLSPTPPSPRSATAPCDPAPGSAPTPSPILPLPPSARTRLWLTDVLVAPDTARRVSPGRGAQAPPPPPPPPPPAPLPPPPPPNSSSGGLTGARSRVVNACHDLPTPAGWYPQLGRHASVPSSLVRGASLPLRWCHSEVRARGLPLSPPPSPPVLVERAVTASAWASPQRQATLSPDLAVWRRLRRQRAAAAEKLGQAVLSGTRRRAFLVWRRWACPIPDQWDPPSPSRATLSEQLGTPRGSRSPRLRLRRRIATESAAVAAAVLVTSRVAPRDVVLVIPDAAVRFEGQLQSVPIGRLHSGGLTIQDTPRTPFPRQGSATGSGEPISPLSSDTGMLGLPDQQLDAICPNSPARSDVTAPATEPPINLGASLGDLLGDTHASTRSGPASDRPPRPRLSARPSRKQKLLGGQQDHISDPMQGAPVLESLASFDTPADGEDGAEARFAGTCRTESEAHSSPDPRTPRSVRDSQASVHKAATAVCAVKMLVESIGASMKSQAERDDASRAVSPQHSEVSLGGGRLTVRCSTHNHLPDPMCAICVSPEDRRDSGGDEQMQPRRKLRERPRRQQSSIGGPRRQETLQAVPAGRAIGFGSDSESPRSVRSPNSDDQPGSQFLSPDILNAFANVRTDASFTDEADSMCSTVGRGDAPAAPKAAAPSQAPGIRRRDGDGTHSPSGIRGDDTRSPPNSPTAVTVVADFDEAFDGMDIFMVPPGQPEAIWGVVRSVESDSVLVEWSSPPSEWGLTLLSRVDREHWDGAGQARVKARRDGPFVQHSDTTSQQLHSPHQTPATEGLRLATSVDAVVLSALRQAAQPADVASQSASTVQPPPLRRRPVVVSSPESPPSRCRLRYPSFAAARTVLTRTEPPRAVEGRSTSPLRRRTLSPATEASENIAPPRAPLLLKYPSCDPRLFRSERVQRLF